MLLLVSATSLFYLSFGHRMYTSQLSATWSAENAGWNQLSHTLSRSSCDHRVHRFQLSPSANRPTTAYRPRLDICDGRILQHQRSHAASRYTWHCAKVFRSITESLPPASLPTPAPAPLHLTQSRYRAAFLAPCRGEGGEGSCG